VQIQFDQRAHPSQGNPEIVDPFAFAAAGDLFEQHAGMIELIDEISR
jgi:hypothetical protein